jgi:hypothetical protein
MNSYQRILALFYLLLHLEVNGQPNLFPCGSTRFIDQFDDWSIDPTKNYTQNIFKHIKKSFKDTNYITYNRNMLSMLDNTICQDTFMQFKGENLSIEIIFDERNITSFWEASDDVFFPTIEGDNGIPLDSIDTIGMNLYMPILKDLHGSHGTEGTKLKGIKSIVFQKKQGEKIVIPIELYDDLAEPNIYYRYKSYHPIEVFYDEIKKSYYIYIYGKVEINSDTYDLDVSVMSSYVVKIIFDVEKNLSMRYVVPTNKILPFGWFFCEDFWVF